MSGVISKVEEIQKPICDWLLHIKIFKLTAIKHCCWILSGGQGKVDITA
uniref:Uncharacterized protein n=1 Tax=Anguilla anguilla TaxID=7936 RepID=A0A0E9WM72_ANGAN